MKKQMVRISSILLVVFVMFTLMACGEKNTDKESESSNDVSEEIEDVQDIVEDNIEEHGDAQVGAYVTPEESAFTWESVEGGVAVTGYTGSDTAIQIPEQLGGEPVVKIATGAFSNTQVVGVACADSIVRLDEKAFFYCVTLKEVKTGASMKEIGGHSFEGCSVLEKVELNDGLEIIGDTAFGFCTSLKAVELPDTLVRVDGGAFCLSGLESVTVPGGVEEIGQQAFSTCASLKNAVLNDGTKVLHDQVFEACDILESVIIPKSVEELGIDVFIYSDNVTVHAPAGSAAETYATENNVAFEAN